MAVTSHSVAFKRVGPAYTSSRRWAAPSGKFARLIGRNDEFYQVFWYFGRLSWSPDGKLLAFSDRTDLATNPLLFFSYRSIHSEVRRLTSPRDSRVITILHSHPMVEHWLSTRLAGSHGNLHDAGFWRRGTTSHLGCSIRMGSGVDARRTRHCFRKAGWLADAGWLWKIPRGGGEPERLQFGQEGVEPSIRGNRLVYARQMANLNIWREETQFIGFGRSFRKIHIFHENRKRSSVLA